jgi:hypothetical protein
VVALRQVLGDRPAEEHAVVPEPERAVQILGRGVVGPGVELHAAAAALAGAVDGGGDEHAAEA